MRVGFTSDFHLGFGSGRRKGDAVLQAKRAVRKLLEQDVDVLVIAGDLFDSPVPRPETLRDAAEVLRPTLKREPLQLTGVGRDSPELRGMPVLAIHGNHDRRIKGEVNPTQLLGLMGYLVYLHNNGVLVEDTGFFGVGSVPESYSRRVFRSLDVRPFGDPSFFIFHQDILPYLPNAPLKFSDLPRGFSYYVDGHIHASHLDKNFLVVGSTVVTQMKPDELEKCVWVWDGGFEKHPIDSRPFHYMEVDAAGRSPSEVLAEIDGVLQKIVSRRTGEEPMVRIRVVGKLAPGFKPTDLVFRNDYGLIVSFDKRLEGTALSTLEPSELNVDELAVKTLKEVLKERGLKLDVSKLYACLLKGDEAAVWRLLEESA